MAINFRIFCSLQKPSLPAAVLSVTPHSKGGATLRQLRGRLWFLLQGSLSAEGVSNRGVVQNSFSFTEWVKEISRTDFREGVATIEDAIRLDLEDSYEVIGDVTLRRAHSQGMAELLSVEELK